MDESQNYLEDEISIHDLVNLLLKGKKLIIAITVIALLVSALAGFVVLENVYETKTTINANPISITAARPTDKEGSLLSTNTVVQELTGFPSLTVATYLQQIVSKNVLNMTISSLGLTAADGQPLTDRALKEMITIANPTNTNMIEITVKHGDPALAASIANGVATSFIQYINDLYKTATEQAISKIANQLTLEEQNLAEKSQAVVSYLQNHDNVDVLKGEITSLVEQINANQTELNRIETEIAIDSATLQTLLKLYPNIKSTLINDLQLDVKVPAEDQTSPNDGIKQQDSVIQFSAPNDQLSASLVRIELNTLQNRIIKNTNSQAVLAQTIDTMQVSLKAKKAVLTEEEYQYNSLMTDLELAKSTYNAYQQRHKEFVLASASDLGGSNIVITSTASIPENPVSPNKLQILLIGTLLGFMAGCALVLFKHYWQADDKKTLEEAK